jgi:hypothetical protein
MKILFRQISIFYTALAVVPLIMVLCAFTDDGVNSDDDRLSLSKAPLSFGICQEYFRGQNQSPEVIHKSLTDSTHTILLYVLNSSGANVDDAIVRVLIPSTGVVLNGTPEADGGAYRFQVTSDSFHLDISAPGYDILNYRFHLKDKNRVFRLRMKRTDERSYLIINNDFTEGECVPIPNYENLYVIRLSEKGKARRTKVDRLLRGLDAVTDRDSVVKRFSLPQTFGGNKKDGEETSLLLYLRSYSADKEKALLKKLRSSSLVSSAGPVVGLSDNSGVGMSNRIFLKFKNSVADSNVKKCLSDNKLDCNRSVESMKINGAYVSAPIGLGIDGMNNIMSALGKTGYISSGYPEIFNRSITPKE